MNPLGLYTIEFTAFLLETRICFQFGYSHYSITVGMVPHSKISDHGETVLNTLTTRFNARSSIVGHSQIIKHPAYITRQLSDGRRHTVFANGFNQTDRKSTQPCDVFRAMAGANCAAIFVPVPVECIVMAFHAPMSSIKFQAPVERSRSRVNGW